MARTMPKTRKRVRISGAERLQGIARLPQEGAFTATETGAKEAADIKHRFQTQRDILNAAVGQQTFEEFLKTGKGPRKKKGK